MTERTWVPIYLGCLFLLDDLIPQDSKFLSPLSFYSWFIYLNNIDLHSLVHSPQWPQEQEPGTSSGSPPRMAGTRVLCLPLPSQMKCLPRSWMTVKLLGQSQGYDTGCRCHRQRLNLVCHNTNHLTKLKQGVYSELASGCQGFPCHLLRPFRDEHQHRAGSEVEPVLKPRDSGNGMWACHVSP